MKGVLKKLPIVLFNPADIVLQIATFLMRNYLHIQDVCCFQEGLGYWHCYVVSVGTNLMFPRAVRDDFNCRIDCGACDDEADLLLRLMNNVSLCCGNAEDCTYIIMTTGVVPLACCFTNGKLQGFVVFGNSVRKHHPVRAICSLADVCYSVDEEQMHRTPLDELLFSSDGIRPTPLLNTHLLRSS